MESNCNVSEPHLTADEKLSKGRDLKDQGNEFFKMGEWRSAMKRYHTALLYLKGVNSPSVGAILGMDNNACSNKEVSKELDEDRKNLEFSCNNNLAVCHLKKKNYEKVIFYSTKALDHDPNNIKALFRRGQAYFETKMVDKAKEDFLQVRKLDPKETAVRKFLTEIEEEEKVQLAKEKEMYSTMFQKMAKSS